MTKNSKFIAQEKNPLLNPVDFFNFNGDFIKIFEGIKDAHVKSDTEICFLDPTNLDASDINKPTFILKNGLINTIKNNKYDIAEGSIISKFMLLSAIKFKGDFSKTMSYVSFTYMKSEIPYIRVGCDYYKKIKKKDRWGTVNYKLKVWKKDEISQDHTKSIFPLIHKFDDFTLIPNNKEFIPVETNCYNLYSQFSHYPINDNVTEIDIPNSINLIKHIFGEQYELGLKYLKILYEFPEQILPVLAVISTERETGKTTFLNWMSILFGENSTLITPNDLEINFNAGYSAKNIIMIDETVIEKSKAIEKLKSISTAKQMSVSQKHAQPYSIPFYGKVIIATNKEKDFMRIDEEEVRFWIRKIKTIENKNTKIESELVSEIPKFLKFLIQLPEIDFTKSRMVFTKEEINTNHLSIVKEESKSGLRKDIEIKMQDVFIEKDVNEFEATATDIKERWFSHNNQISLSYIRKVLKDEMKLISANKAIRYHPFAENKELSKVGLPFLFQNNAPLEKAIQTQIDTPF